jgi:hypothetical protein
VNTSPTTTVAALPIAPIEDADIAAVIARVVYAKWLDGREPTP